jgi:hypothetical protein
MKIRKIKSGGVAVIQLITKNFIFSYCNNKAWFNGNIGRTFDIKLRKNTNL